MNAQAEQPEKQIYIDTHAHLDDKRYSNIAEIVAQSDAAGVKRIIIPGTSLANSAEILELAKTSPALYVALGLHPGDTSFDPTQLAETMEALGDLITKAGQKCVAVGEIGLDYHYKDNLPRATQQSIFRAQLDLAAARKLPVVVHIRDAWDDTLRILQEWAAATPRTGLYRGIAHCWFGTPEQSWELRKLGFLMGVGGSVTFKNSTDLQASVRKLPLNSFVLETDCPYLAPIPYRGKTNSPAYIPLIAKAIAEVRGGAETVDEVAAVTTRNARVLFGQMALPPEPAYAYSLGTNLYIALTNRCSCDCVFCTRKQKPLIHGWDLKQDADPSRDVIMTAIKSWGPDFERFKEVVFCGFGEPTLRLNLLLEVAKWLKEHGAKKIRINTNGMSDLINGKDSVDKMINLIDAVSVSLNAVDKDEYNRTNRPQDPEHAWEAIHDFIRAAVKKLPECIVSTVGLPGREKEVAIIEARVRELGAKFRLRPLEDLSK